MEKQAFISIIIVCYNYGHLLPRALNAIAKQDFRDFEIVFVDNGCTDNSLEVMRCFSERHPDIHITFVTINRNIGLPYGDNKGVEAATGKYLMFHDADDWMDDNTLGLLADAASRNNADRVIPAFRDVDDNGNVLQVQELGKEPNHWLYSLVQGNLFRASIYKQHHINTQTNSPDVEKTFWFSSLTGKTAYVFSPCYNMLVHMDSTSRAKDTYKKLLSDDRSSTTKLLKICIPKVPEKGCPEHTMAVYALTRLYYGHIFRFLRYAPLADTLQIYTALHKAMEDLLPDYLDCTKKALKEKNAVRPYGRKVAMLAFNLERFHLMHIGLFCYHYISKLVYLRE